MANKYYAVHSGKVPGIYETWSECSAQVSGIKGAIYKGFSSKNDAENFVLNGNSGNIQSSNKPKKKKYYAVINGDGKGVYDSWDTVQNILKNTNSTQQRSFKLKEDAERAVELERFDVVDIKVKEKMQDADINIFTDGGSDMNPGVSGFGCVIINDNEIEDYYQGFEKSTNNRMEMMGILYAFNYIIDNDIKGKTIQLFSDSKLTLTGIKNERNKNSEGKNLDLWESLYQARKVVESQNVLMLAHVNSHIGIEYNERVDKLVHKAKNSNNKKIDYGYLS